MTKHIMVVEVEDVASYLDALKEVFGHYLVEVDVKMRNHAATVTFTHLLGVISDPKGE